MPYIGATGTAVIAETIAAATGITAAMAEIGTGAKTTAETMAAETDTGTEASIGGTDERVTQKHFTAHEFFIIMSLLPVSQPT